MWNTECAVVLLLLKTRSSRTKAVVREQQEEVKEEGNEGNGDEDTGKKARLSSLLSWEVLIYRQMSSNKNAN